MLTPLKGDKDPLPLAFKTGSQHFSSGLVQTLKTNLGLSDLLEGNEWMFAFQLKVTGQFKRYQLTLLKY